MRHAGTIIILAMLGGCAPKPDPTRPAPMSCQGKVGCACGSHADCESKTCNLYSSIAVMGIDMALSGAMAVNLDKPGTCVAVITGAAGDLGVTALTDWIKEAESSSHHNLRLPPGAFDLAAFSTVSGSLTVYGEGGGVAGTTTLQGGLQLKESSNITFDGVKLMSATDADNLKCTRATLTLRRSGVTGFKLPNSYAILTDDCTFTMDRTAVVKNEAAALNVSAGIFSITNSIFQYNKNNTRTEVTIALKGPGVFHFNLLRNNGQGPKNGPVTIQCQKLSKAQVENSVLFGNDSRMGDNYPIDSFCDPMSIVLLEDFSAVDEVMYTDLAVSRMITAPPSLKMGCNAEKLIGVYGTRDYFNNKRDKTPCTKGAQVLP